jgi:hypothetical protein
MKAKDSTTAKARKGKAAAASKRPAKAKPAFLAAGVPLRHMQKRIFFEPAVYYACTGNCLGLVSRQSHGKGHTHCKIIVCSNYGKPLAKMHYCRACKAHFLPSERHRCAGK